MHDPSEGVAPDGTIRTGARRDAVPCTFLPVIEAAIAALPTDASLYVYGSVATGTAVAPSSDVDLLSVGLPADAARQISGELSVRFDDRCRKVSIAAAAWEQLEASDDEAYGLRVLVRHYGVHLAGDDPGGRLPAYPADARAARGFNGDIGRHAARWGAELAGGVDLASLGVRIARKTLLAVAGLVSVRDGTWTTDRRASAARWDEFEPGTPVEQLTAWLDDPPQDAVSIARTLHGPVAAVVRAFRSEIGLWTNDAT